jgi:glutamate dehydrogenase/leucine dehydrogenase
VGICHGAEEHQPWPYREFAEKYGCKYVAGARPWGEVADIALPSATQNEINGEQAAH